MVYINIDMGKQMKNFRKTIYLSIIFNIFISGGFSPNFLLKLMLSSQAMEQLIIPTLFLR